MKRFLVGLQLLLSCALLLGSSVSRSEEDSSSEESQERDDLPAPSFQSSEDYVAPTSDELEEREERHRHAMETEGVIFPLSFLKTKAIQYFNEGSHGPFYRHLEDTDIKVKPAIGTMIHFSMLLVDTNCTLQEGQRAFGSDHYLYAVLREDRRSHMSLPCVPPPKGLRRTLKCTFQLFLDGRSKMPAVVDHECTPVEIFRISEETLDD